MKNSRRDFFRKDGTGILASGASASFCNGELFPETDMVKIDIKIPVNTTAKVFFPVKLKSIVSERATRVSKVADNKIISDKDG